MYSSISSLFMAQSSSSPGNKLKAMNEDEHPSTYPSKETTVVEIPSLRTQLVELNGDTEVLDIPDFANNLRAHMVDDSDNEVVLDSDDEEIQRDGVLTVVKGLSCDGPNRIIGHKSGFLLRRGSTVAVSKSVEANSLAKSSLTDKQSNHGVCSNHVEPRYEEATAVKNGIFGLQYQRTSGTTVDAANLGHDSCVPEPASLSDIETQEPEESAQEALDFVGHYLSVNDVTLPQEVEIGIPNKLTSRPALSAKGTWNLARGANLRTKVWDSRSFDWDDKQPELILGWNSQQERSVSMPQRANNMKFQEERKVGEKCKDINLNLVDSRLIVHKSNQISEVRKAAETANIMQSSMELGKQFDAEPLRQQPETNSSEWDVPDMDVGFDTQMAAEAIEALLDAPPPSHDANNNQGVKNMLENTSKFAAVKNVAMGSSYSDSGCIGSEVEQTKRSANKLNRNKSISFQNDTKNKVELDLSVEVKKKVQRGKSLTNKCTRDLKPQSRASKTSSKVISQKEEEGFSEKENIKCIRNLCLSKAVNCALLGQIQDKVRFSSPVACRTRRQSVESSMTTEDPNCHYGGRKRRGLDTNKLWGGRRKRSKLGVDSSVEATDCETSKNLSSLDIATNISDLKSTLWIFPKRKRTCHYVSALSELPSMCTLSNVLVDENCNWSDERCEIKSKGELRTPCLSSTIKRKVRPAQSSWHSSDETCVDNTIAGKFNEESFESVVITGQMALVNLAKDKASEKFSKLDKVDHISSAAGKENKESEVSNANVQASTIEPKSEKTYKQKYKRKSSRSRLLKDLTEQMAHLNSAKVNLFENKGSELSNTNVQASSGKDYKPQYKRNSLRPPLLKELTRLGFAESLPDFVSKDLRRRRNKSNIHVLFSQSLDGPIIRKQKKILARLGISVASDCSDATHFVTDRFVRTRNMLEAMALGKPIVTHLWLENCSDAKCLVDEKKYILHDIKREKELGFNMLVSLARAKKHPLLKDRRVIVTPNVKPSREMIEILVKKVHGKVVKGSLETARKDKVILNDILILSCEEDYAVCVPFLEDGASVYSSELLLNGIVIQKLEYEKHRLFKDHVHSMSERSDQHVPSATCQRFL